MDFKIDRYVGEKSENRVIGVPSDKGGVFVVDHGSHYGKRMYGEIDLGKVSNIMAEEINSGDTSLVENWFVTNPDKPGFYKIVHGIGNVSIELPGSRNTVHDDVTEFVELSPRASRFISDRHVQPKPTEVDYPISGNNDVIL
jgi:hypothetical protein